MQIPDHQFGGRPQPNSTDGPNWLLLFFGGGSLVVLLLGCCCCSCFALVPRSDSESGGDGSIKLKPGLDLPTLDPNAPAAFSNVVTVDRSSQEYLEINSLLSRLTKASWDEDEDRFIQLVDKQRMFVEIRKHLKSGDEYESEHRDIFFNEYGLDIPTTWYEYQIVSIQPGAANNERRVYLHMELDEDDRFNIRIDLINNNGWKMFDFFILDHLYLKSFDEALTFVYADGDRSTEWDRITEQFDTIENAYGEEDIAECKKKVADITVDAVFPERRGKMARRLGEFYASYVLDSERAREIYESYPAEKQPVLLYALGHSYFADDLFEEALAAVEEYRKLVGFNPSVAHLEAQCLFSLDRNEEATELLRQIEEREGVLNE